MSTNLTPYVPIDRRHALYKGESLPDRSTGVALFADISGFTPLAEALAAQLGPQRGAEELTHQLNRVYQALIAQVHNYGGSVIGFVGDAITCWFGEDPSAGSGQAGLRATACALAMQAAMQPFANAEVSRGITAAFSIKVGIASGPARRFRVGDPAMQYIDVLAGDTLRRMSLAEGLAHKGQGEVLLDAAAFAQVKDGVSVREWRAHPETGERFAVVAELAGPVAPTPWPDMPSAALTEAQVRPWVLPPVYQRLEAGQSEYLAQLRPAVSLFLKFAGLEYDRDEAAGDKLDAYIRWVQRVVNRYEGSLIQLTIGDKGSFMYAAFGAPLAHEDDAIRAVMAALDLQALPAELDFVTSTQIGVAQGQARTGAYGSDTRRSYGVIGDDAVLACRLMGVAPAGEIRCDYNVYRRTDARIGFEGLPPVRVKGKAGLVRVYRPSGQRAAVGRQRLAVGEQGRLVGRKTEVARLQAALDAVQAGEARVLVVEGEAGIGKSRLTAELTRLVQERGLAWLLGTGQSIEQQTPYRAWRDVFSYYFGLDEVVEPSGQAPSTGPSALLSTGSGQAPSAGPSALLRTGSGQALIERRERVRRVVMEVVPDQIERLPLLNDVLNLGLPETELTEALEPKLRQQSLVALLLSLLRAWARERPLILVLEDAHWLDSLSWELAVQAARALTVSGEPLLLVLVTRPPDEHSVGAQPAATLRAMANAETLSLTTLGPDETVALVTARLGLPEGNLPDPVAELVRERAGGNPFFAEELVLTLRDQGIIAVEPVPNTPDLSASAAAKPGSLNRCVINGDLARASQTLPDTVQGLVLARVDRLPPGQQLTLKVASVIGRVFAFRTLREVHPVEADRLHLPDHLDALARLDVTLLETPEPELAHAFKHIITQEVAYESLLYAHRRELHHRVGKHLERTYPDSLEEYYELLAHHYVQSGDREKSWDYVLKAGDKARDKYANEAATAYYNKALSLDIDSEREREDVYRVHESLAGVLALVGRYDEALKHYASARALLEADALWEDRAHLLANLCHQTAEVYERRSEYDVALEWLEKGLRYIDGAEPTLEAARIYMLKAALYYRQCKYDQAVDWCQKGLDIALPTKTREGQRVVARACYLLGLISTRRGDLGYAVQLCLESVRIYREIDDLVEQANAYNNLANAYFSQGEWTRASDAQGKSLAVRQRVGDIYGQAMLANNLAEIYLYRGDWVQATSLYEQSYAIWEQIGAPLGEAVALSNLAQVHIYQENWPASETCLSRSQAILAQIGPSEGFVAELERRWGEFYLHTGRPDQALNHTRRSIELAVEQGNPLEEGMSRRVLGQLHLARGEWEPAEAALRQSLQILKRLNSEYEAAKTELALARFAAETGSISTEEAQKHLAQAIETFEKLGAQADLAEARSLAIT